MSKLGIFSIATILSLPFLLGAGCSPTAEVASLRQIEQTIFVKDCALAGCHAAASPQNNLNLSASTYGNLVNVQAVGSVTKKRIVAGNPAGSFLFEKISSSRPETGDRMPPGRVLSSSSIELIRTWIQEGAQNN